MINNNEARKMNHLSVQPKVKTVTENDLDDLVNNNSLAIIDCWAPWCGPCRMLSPIIEELAEELTSNIAFGKLNIDENARIAERFRITAIPTVLFFKNGKRVDTLIGAVPKSTLKEKIQTLT